MTNRLHTKGFSNSNLCLLVPANLEETKAMTGCLPDALSSRHDQVSSIGRGPDNVKTIDSKAEKSLAGKVARPDKLGRGLAGGDHQSEPTDGGLRRRFHIALLGLAIAVVNCYAQATFCISIVEMVLPADFAIRDSEQPSAAGSVDERSCPIEYRYRDYYDSWRFPSNTTSSPASDQTMSSMDMSDRFDWDASRQGILLGAFAIGTAPLQVLGGRLAEIYGAKWVLLAGCLGTALTNLSIPVLARHSFLLLVLNRVLMGVSQAGMEPGLMCLLAEWLTPDETGFFISMLLFAICIGFFLGSLGSSFLLTLGYGWPMTYYISGYMNLLVGVLWLLYASSRPRESKHITPEELKYIELAQQVARKAVNDDLIGQHISSCARPLDKAGLGADSNRCHCPEQAGRTARASAPWKNILRTRSVWAFIICKISIRWCADVVSIELPTYLANVLHLSIKLNGILNSVSSALFAIFSFITGYLVNEVLKLRQKRLQAVDDGSRARLTGAHVGATREWPAKANKDNEGEEVRFFKRWLTELSKTNLRKTMQSVASFGSALTVFLMTRYDCNIILSMSMLLILSCCLVMGTGGELQIPYDMTSRYPGTLHGMACTLSVSGWLAPPLIGLILGDQPNSRYRWSIVWYLTALINLIGGLVFLLFADASPRDFDSAVGPDGGREAASASDRRRSDRAPTGYWNEVYKSQDNSPVQHRPTTACEPQVSQGFRSRRLELAAQTPAGWGWRTSLPGLEDEQRPEVRGAYSRLAPLARLASSAFRRRRKRFRLAPAPTSRRAPPVPDAGAPEEPHPIQQLASQTLVVPVEARKTITHL